MTGCFANQQMLVALLFESGVTPPAATRARSRRSPQPCIVADEEVALTVRRALAD
jgi:hypothetical protein